MIYRYHVSPGNRIFEMQYQLPKGLTCQQCVMQWRYIAGNNWGKYKINKNIEICIYYVNKKLILSYTKYQYTHNKHRTM